MSNSHPYVTAHDKLQTWLKESASGKRTPVTINPIVEEEEVYQLQKVTLKQEDGDYHLLLDYSGARKRSLYSTELCSADFSQDKIIAVGANMFRFDESGELGKIFRGKAI